MTFNAKKSGVKDARTELGQLETWVRECNDRCADVNTTFSSIMMGAWADAEVQAAMQLQTYLVIYADALDAMHTTYDSMISTLDGSLSSKRDAVLEAVKASTGNDDVVHFDDTGAVTTGVSDSETALSALTDQIGVATSALSGLENSGEIAAALEDLLSATENEAEDIEKVGTKYTAYQDAVEDFEEKYAKALAGENFITDDMLDHATKVLTDQFEGAGAAGLIGGAAAFKKNILSPVKKAFDAYAKPLSEINAGNAVALWTQFKNVVVDKKYWYYNDYVKAVDDFLCTNGQEAKKFFSTYIDDVTGFLRPSQYAKQWKKITNALNLSDAAKKSMSYADEAAGLVDDIADSASRTGTVFRGLAKYGGYVGDFIELGSGLMAASEAYQTTAGDGAQKAAAATVTTIGAVAKFGAGKVAGALIGTALCGPLGAVVGIGLGFVIDEVVDGIGTALNEGGATQWLTDSIAWVFRGGKEDDSAFAVA